MKKLRWIILPIICLTMLLGAFAFCIDKNFDVTKAEDKISEDVIEQTKEAFENKETFEKGGQIFVGKNSSFTLSEGEISYGVAVKGGAVYVSSGATFTMNGGEIKCNQAIYGGAIYVESGGTVNLNGGKICNNYAQFGHNGNYAIYAEPGAVVNYNGTTLIGNDPVEYTDVYAIVKHAITNEILGAIIVEDVTDDGFTVYITEDNVPYDFNHCNGYYTDREMTELVDDTGLNAYTEGNGIYYSKSEIDIDNGEKAVYYTVPITDEELEKFEFSIWRISYNGNPEYAIYADESITGVDLEDEKGNAVEGLVTIPYMTDVGGTYQKGFVSAISSFGFMFCEDLKNIILPHDLCTIEKQAFYGSGITNINIKTGFVNDIGEAAFADCANLTSVDLSNTNIKNVNNNLFAGCGNLKSVVLPDGIKNIGVSSFYGCSSLEEIEISNTVTSIGDWAFGNCESLSEIEIPSSVTNLGEDAFFECTGLESATVNANIGVLNKSVFEGCSSLTDITLPDSLTNILEYVFYNCGALQSITIPDNVTQIGRGVFQYCTNLVTVIMSDNVETIGEEVFSGCEKLIHLNNWTGGEFFRNKLNVSSIGSQAFYGCQSLTEIYLPGLREIGREALVGTGISHFWIPYGDSVKVSEGAFYSDSNILIYTSRPGESISPEFWFTGWNNKNELEAHTVRYGVSYEEYRYCLLNSDFELSFEEDGNDISVTIDKYVGSSTEVQIPEEIQFLQKTFNVTTIGRDCFKNKTMVTKINLVDTINTIGDLAFYGCTQLSTINLEVTSISELSNATFYNCSSLSRINIPSTVTEIGSDCFYGCSNLNNVVLPDGLTKIGMWAFADCSALTSINIPSGVKDLKAQVFYGCTSLSSVEGLDHVERIGFRAFAKTKITEVYLPNLKEIGKASFRESAIERIWIPSNIKTIKDAYDQQIVDGIKEGVFYGTNLTIYTNAESKPDSWDENWNYPSAEATEGNLVVWGVSYVEYLYSILYSDFIFEFYGTNVTITGYIGDGGAVEIPETTVVTVNNTSSTYNVVKIANDVFCDCTEITSIKFVDTITEIGQQSFYGCTFMTINGNLPSSLLTIGNSAFEGCSAITQIVIPDSVTSLGVLAFKGCSGATSLTIGSGVGVIEESTFEGCSVIAEIVIPNTVTNVGASSFKGCSGATKLTLGTSVQVIGDSAFENCSSVTSNLIIQNATITIGSKAFYECSRISRLQIGNSVKNIGNEAFASMSKIDIVRFYASEMNNLNADSKIFNNSGTNGFQMMFNDYVKVIPNYLCYNAENLKQITLANASTTIGDYAFANSGLSGTLSITSVIRIIGTSAFEGCSGLTKITIPEDSSLTTINDKAFTGCTGLTSIWLPDTVNSIPAESAAAESPFYGCSNMVYIYTAHDGSIDPPTGWGSFCNYKTNEVQIPIRYNCTFENYNSPEVYYSDDNLWQFTVNPSVASGDSAIEVTIVKYLGHATIVAVPETLTATVKLEGDETDKQYTFNVVALGADIINGSTTITSFTVPNCITSIECGALSGCDTLTSLTVPFVGETLTTCNYLSHFFGGTLYVENGGNTIPISLKNVGITSEALTTIAANMFNRCVNLTTVTLPKNLVTVGDSVFLMCSSLNSVTFTGTKLTELGMNSFSNCVSLVSINLPAGVKTIGQNAFSSCDLLESINLPDSVTSIGGGAFQNCKKLESINLSNVTYVGNIAFGRCHALTEANLSGLTVINKSSFEYCTALVSLTFGDHLKAIYEDAFVGCTGLMSINIPDSVTSIGNKAFGACHKLKTLNSHNEVNSINVQTIGEGAFNGCWALDRITIKNAVSIGKSAFDNTTKLQHIWLPYNTLTTLVEGSFYNSHQIKIYTDCPSESKKPAGWATGWDYRNSAKAKHVVYWNTSYQAYLYATKYSDFNFSFNYIDENNIEATITNYVGAQSADVVLPPVENIDGITIKVVKIGDNAFASKSILSIKFVDTIKEIGDHSFESCSYMTINGNLPSSLTTIGYCAFFNCLSISEIIIPDSVIEIGEFAFEGCTSCTTLTIGKGVQGVGIYAFAGLSSLETINFNAIEMSDLWSENYIFNGSGSENLRSINIGPNVTQIPSYMFCYLFIDEFPERVYTTLNFLGDKCERIGDYAFAILNIVRINIPNSVTTIGEAAFYMCTVCTSLTIGEGVEDVGISAFSRMDSLVEINFNAVNMNDLVVYVDEVKYTNPLFITDNEEVHFNTVKITIGENVERVPAYLFMTYQSLQDSTVLFKGEKCKSIGAGAFAYLAISELILSEGIEEIEALAFACCEYLKKIYIPSSVENIITTYFNFDNQTIEDSSTDGSPFYGCQAMQYIYAGANEKPDGWQVGFNYKDSYTEIPVIWGASLDAYQENYLQYGDWLYKLSAGNAILVKYLGEDTEIKVPSSVTTYYGQSFTVKTLGESLFEDMEFITKITLPSSVKTIEAFAFSGCINLIDIRQIGKEKGYLPSVTKVENYAFYCCESLTEIYLQNLTRIGDTEVFVGTGLTHFYLPLYAQSRGDLFDNTVVLYTSEDDIQNLGAARVEYKYSFNEYLYAKNFLDFSFTFSGYDGTITAYHGSDSIVYIPTKVNGMNYCTKIVGESLFEGNEDIVSVILTEDIIELKASAFKGCTSLININTDTSYGTINGNNINNLLINNFVIGASVFENCSSLTEIYLPNVTQISSAAFKNSGLKHYFISSTATLVSADAFSGVACEFYTNLSTGASYPTGWASGWENGNTVTKGLTFAQYLYKHYYSDYNFTFNGENLTITGYTGVGGSVVIPGKTTVTIDGTSTIFNVVEIGGSAFRNNATIISIRFVDTITLIGSYAFSNCINMTINGDLPSALNTITYKAFYGCSSITNLTIPDATTTIGQNAFELCSGVINLRIGTGVKSVGANAFANMSSLSNINFHATNMNDITPLNNDGALSSIFVGAGSSYNVGGGQINKNISITVYNVTKIPNYVFYGMYNVTKVTFAETSCTSIGDYSFANLGIAKISIPDSVKTIGTGAFENCIGLSLVEISEDSSLESIGEKAFSATDLSNIWLPSSAIMISASNKENSPFANSLYMTAIYYQGSSWQDGWSEHFNYHIDKEDDWQEIPIYYNIRKEWIEDPYIIDGPWIYSVSGTNATVVKYIGAESNVVIPVSFVAIDKNYNVTTISQGVFNGNSTITSLTIPNTYTSVDIQSGVLSGCNTLSSLTTPLTWKNGANTVTLNSLGYLFGGTNKGEDFATNNSLLPNSLTSVVINNGTIVSDYFAALCGKLVNIELPTTIQTIGLGAFMTCTSLENVNFGELTSLTTIGNSSFNGCSKLTGVTLPSKVTTIGVSAFNACSNLQSIMIPNSVTSIGESAFTNCNKAQVLVIGTSVTGIGKNAFKGCSAIQSIMIPDSVTSVGESAFEGCSSVKTLVVGSGVTEIKDNTFKNCSSVEFLTIGAGLTSIAANSFAGMTKLTSINYNASNLSDSVDSESSNQIFANAGTAAAGITVTIGAKVKRIPAYIFKNLTSIKTVNFATSTTSATIGLHAFSGCTGLETVNFNNKPVTTISGGAFQNCSSLTSIAIPAGVTTMNSYVFSNCTALENVTFGGNITSINQYAFYNCTSLETVDLTKATLIDRMAFKQCVSLNGITLSSSLKTIGYQAFYGCTALISIAIPNSVSDTENTNVDGETTIIPGLGEASFQNCTNLQTVSIGSGVTHILASTFSGCTSLASIVIPNSVITISENAFNGCTAATSLTIGTGVTTISTNAFNNLNALTSINFNAVNMGNLSSDGLIFTNAGSNGEGITVNIGADVIQIPSYLFYNITTVTELIFGGDSECSIIGGASFYGTSIAGELIIPESVKTIDSVAFCGCDNITSVKFSAIEYLLWGAFSYCSNLTSVDVGSSLILIEDDVFVNCANLTKIWLPASLSSIYYIGDQGNIASPFTGCNKMHTIYTAHASKPDGWGDYFNYRGEDSIIPVIYGDADKTYYNMDARRDGDWIFTVIDNNTNANIVKYLGAEANLLVPTTLITRVDTVDKELPVTSISSTAFNNNTSINTIWIPSCVTNIEIGAFYGASNMTAIYLEVPANEYSYAAGFNYDNDREIPDYYGIERAFLFEPYVISGDWVYSIPEVATVADDGTLIATAVRYIGLETEVSTPESFTYNNTTYSVTSLAQDVLKNTKVITFTISDSITSIAKGALSNCSTLTTLSTPFVGDGGDNMYLAYMFGGASYNDYLYVSSALVEVFLTNTTEISNYAFYYCNKITTINIGNNIIKIGKSSFEGCSGLSSIIIPNCVTEIGSAAFKNTKIDSITIPNSVTKIGDSAFEGCVEVTEINYNSNITNTLNSSSFIFKGTGKSSGCVVAINSSVTSIATYLFTEANITKLVFDGNSCTKIGAYAFYNCKKLSEITIPSSVTSLGNSVFENCTALWTVSYNANITSNLNYNSYVFKNAGAGTCMVTIGTNVTLLPGNLFRDSNITSLTFISGSNCLTIGNNALYNCDYLHTVILIEGLTTIGEYAFYSCSMLFGLEIPASVSSIGVNFCADCDWMETLTVKSGNSKYRSSNNAIYEGTILKFGCAATSSIDSNTTKIESYAFYECSCEGFEYQQIEIKTPTATTDIVIGSYAFAYSGIKYININAQNSTNSVVQDYAFYMCESLHTAYLTGTNSCIKEIGKYAFAGSGLGNPSLASLVLGFRYSQVEIIKDYAFKDCKYLQYFEVSSKTTSLAGNAFIGCDAENSLTLTVASGHSVYRAENNVIYRKSNDAIVCGYLMSGYVELNNNIEYAAFEGNKKLTSVLLGQNITNIGSSAFKNCYNINVLNYNIAGSPTIGEDWFDNAGNNVGDGIAVGFHSAVTVIPEKLFYASGANITQIDFNTSYSASAPRIGSKAFYGLSTITKIHNFQNLGTITTSANNNLPSYQKIASDAFGNIGKVSIYFTVSSSFDVAKYYSILPNNFGFGPVFSITLYKNNTKVNYS